MLQLQVTGAFRRDRKRIRLRGKDLTKLDAVVERLLRQEPLVERHRDYKLKGSWSGYRECHIEPDWLVIYKVDPPHLRLERTGTHDDLFGR